MANENYTVQDLQDNLNYLNETKGIIKNAIIAKGQTIENSDTFRSYAEKISAIETGAGVKLFETEKEMQADPKAKEGDLAVVYKSEIQNMTADLEVTALTFPEKVTLPAAFTDNTYCSIRAVDSSVMFDGNCELSQTSFRFDGWSESGMIRVEYTSEDGITYNRTRFQGDSGDLTNPVQLPTACKIERAEEWDDNLGYFMQIGGMNFEGLYEYKEYNDKDFMYMYKDITYSYDDSNKLQVNYGEKSVFPIAKYYDMINTIRKDIGLSGYIDAACVYDGNDTLTLYYYKSSDTSTYTSKCYFYKGDADTFYIGRSSSTTYTKKLTITLSTGKYTETSLSLINTATPSYYIYDTINLDSYIFSLCIGSAGIDWSYTIAFAGNSHDNTSIVTAAIPTLPEVKHDYLSAPNQFSLVSSNQLLPGITAYGKNGIVEGDDSVWKNINLAEVMKKQNNDAYECLLLQSSNASGNKLKTVDKFTDAVAYVKHNTQYETYKSYYPIKTKNYNIFYKINNGLEFIICDSNMNKLYSKIIEETTSYTSCFLLSTEEINNKVYITMRLYNNTVRNFVTGVVVDSSSITRYPIYTLPSEARAEKAIYGDNDSFYFFVRAAYKTNTYYVYRMTKSSTGTLSTTTLSSTSTDYAFIIAKDNNYIYVIVKGFGSMLVITKADNSAQHYNYLTSDESLNITLCQNKGVTYLQHYNHGTYKLDGINRTKVSDTYNNQNLRYTFDSDYYIKDSDMIITVSGEDIGVTKSGDYQKEATNIRKLIRNYVAGGINAGYTVYDGYFTDDYTKYIEIYGVSATGNMKDTKYYDVIIDFTKSISTEGEIPLLNINDGLEGYLAISNSINPDYSNTISPEEYNTAVDTADQILGSNNS